MKLNQQQTLGVVAFLIMTLLIALVWHSALRPEGPKSTPGRPPIYKVKSDPPVSNTMTVEIPGFGSVVGYKSSPELSVPDIRKYAPETFVLDGEGNFLYFRNHAPRYKSKRRLDLVEKFFDVKYRKLAEIARNNDEKIPGGAFKILGPAKLPFADPIIYDLVTRYGESDTWDTEAWGVRIHTPTEGEAEALLVGETLGRFRHAFSLKERLTRKWSLVTFENGSWSSSSVDIDEEWIEQPADAESMEGIGIPIDGK